MLRGAAILNPSLAVHVGFLYRQGSAWCRILHLRLSYRASLLAACAGRRLLAFGRLLELSPRAAMNHHFRKGFHFHG